MTGHNARSSHIVRIVSFLFFISLLLISSPANTFEKIDFLFQIGPDIDGNKKNNLKHPSDIAVSKSGIIYLTDRSNNRIVSFNSKGKLLQSFGKRGSKNGEFNKPRGIAIAKNGNIYITDSGNDRVQVFNEEGHFLFSFGDGESGRGDLKAPKGIEIDSQERVVIADSGNKSICFFTLDGIFLGRYGADGKEIGQFEKPSGIAVDKEDNIYVSDEKTARVQVFDHTMQALMYYEKKDKKDKTFGSPMGLEVDRFGYILYADKLNSKIQQIDPSGTINSPFGSQGSGRGQFNGLESIYFHEEADRLYVADAKNNRIQVFKTTLRGGLVPLRSAADRQRIDLDRSIPHLANDIAITDKGDFYLINSKKGIVALLSEGGSKVELEFGLDDKGKKLIGQPQSILYTKEGKLYISDSKNSMIHVYDVSGEKLFDFGKYGNKDGYFKKPAGIAVMGENIIVADSGNNRIQVFNKDGIFLSKFGKKGKSVGELYAPVDVAVSLKEELWVVDSGNSRIQIFDLKGKFIRSFGEKGTDKGQFYKPIAIAIDDDGNAYILDGKKGARVQVFDSSAKFLYSFGSPGKNINQLNKASNILTASIEGTKLFISDAGNERIQRINLRQVPSIPGGLRIAGNEKGSDLHWKKNDDSYHKEYMVYAKKSNNENFRLLGDTKDNSFHVDYSSGNAEHIFAVSSLSYGELESPLSTPLTDFFHIGYEKYLQGDFKGAVNELKQLSGNDEPDGKSLLYLGKSYAALKEYKKATATFKSLSELEGFKLVGRYQLGASYLAGRKYNASLKVFEGILKDDPKQVEAKKFIGRIYYERELFQPALDILKEAVNEGLKDEGSYEILGSIYIKSKLLSKAKDSYKEALRLNPDSPLLHKGLARVYEADGKRSLAIKAYKKALSYNLKDEGSYLKLANLYVSTKQLSAAHDAVENVIDLSPENVEALHLRGQIMLLMGRYEDAVVAFQNVLSSRKGHPGALLNLSRAYIEIGQEGEAIKALTQLAKVTPENAEVFLSLGNLNNKKGEKDEALKNFRSCISADPEHLECHKAAAASYLEEGELENGAIHLSEIVRLSPNEAGAEISLAKILNKLGKTGEAIVHLENAIKIDNKNSEVRYHLGTIFMKNKQMTKAITHLKEAVSLSSKFADYHNALGLAYLDQIKLDGAIKEFKAANDLEDREEFKKNLNTAYARKRESLASAEEAPPVEISEIVFGKTFSSIYKYYADNSIGSITVRNNSDDLFKKVKVSVNIKKYMDFPSEKIVEELKPHEVIKVEVKPTFNNELLKITEDISVQAEINVNYFYRKEDRLVTRTQPVTILNRNAMTWANKEMVAAFITPKDEPVVDFARSITQMFHDNGSLLDEKMAKAMQLFDAMGAMGIVYQVDPNNPYADSSLNYEKVDAVQYPRDTLKYKSGDCDDLSILYSALLENVGIETTMLDIPGHLFMAFKTNAKVDDGDKISSSGDLYFGRDGYLWIPVEATMVGKAFAEAWYEGAKEVRKRESDNTLKYIDTQSAWESFKPVTLEERQKIKIPEKKDILVLLAKDLLLQKKKGMEKLAKAYLDILEKKPEDYTARLNLAIIYAKNGFHDDAVREFEAILAKKPDDEAALNNLGNIYFVQENYKKALELYASAAKSNGDDAGIMMNLALVQYKMGRLKLAKEKFREGEKLSPEKAGEFSLLRSLLFD